MFCWFFYILVICFRLIHSTEIDLGKVLTNDEVTNGWPVVGLTWKEKNKYKKFDQDCA